MVNRTGNRPSILDNLDAEARPKSLVHQPKAKQQQNTLLDFVQKRWKTLITGTLILASGVSVLSVAGGNKPELKASQGSTTPDKTALLTLASEDFASLDKQTELQISETYNRLIALEAIRFINEAEKQITDPSQACYRVDIHCVLDQFEADSYHGYLNASNSLNRAGQIEALIRLEVVERARTGIRSAQEPDNSLTAAAIDRRLKARQEIRRATAESKAAELLSRTEKASE